MANNYYDMTGVLMVEKVTPIIRALFEAFELDARDDATGEVYIADIAESTSHSWDSVGDHIDSDLIEALGIDIDGFDDLDIDARLKRLAEHFKVSDRSEIVSFFDDTDFDEEANLDDLVFLAKSFDDGHGLTGYRIEGCWHSSKPRLFEFGGHGEFFGAYYTVSESSDRINSLGLSVEKALAGGDAATAAKQFADRFTGMINGIRDETLRAQVTQQVLARMTPTVPPSTERQTA
ncbi:hypothetical protein [Burkholderia gladioli]|uniref:hypothetical protein n=1 Tax=Burkholderia gladioli TaxID=28095 RepID=UPI001C5DA61C|nr:hypothetical protein [Burkholderia gladioli]MBW5284142.1 hypothetical protein [Burkholderia gladioli]